MLIMPSLCWPKELCSAGSIGSKKVMSYWCPLMIWAGWICCLISCIIIDIFTMMSVFSMKVIYNQVSLRSVPY